MSSGNTKIPYRADIDGLRALAVTSVIIFHLNYNLLPGGFLGVDIFFVISGFLITRIIGIEIQENSFSFANFYVRRIRRILPVFFLVIATTLLAGSILMLPVDRDALFSSARHALFFAANIYFSKERGYFDGASDEKPLLHIWSLSVEEQYYFIWPLLLYLLYLTGSRVLKQQKRLGQPFAIVCMGVLVAACFIWTQGALLKPQSTTKLYFLLQARFGELMIGSITACLPRTKRPGVLLGLPLAGFGAIFASLFLLNKDSLFPGFNAVLPCVGAAALLYAGQYDSYKTTAYSRILSLPGLRYIGLLSYSLYLWHWPVLAYMRYVYGQYYLPWTWNILALLLTAVLSYGSYVLLERKLKSVKTSFKIGFICIYLLPATILLGTSYTLISATPSSLIENKDLTTYGSDVCHGNFDKNCQRGDPEAPASILMTGDSHAAALNTFIDVVGKHEHWRAKVFTAVGCSPVFGIDENMLPAYARKPCIALKNYVHNNFQKYDAVFFTSYWARQLGKTPQLVDENYLTKFKATIETIAKTTPVYVFSDLPQLSVPPSRLAYFENLGLRVHRQPMQEHVEANALIHSIVLSIPNAHWIDLSPALDHFSQGGVYRGLPTYFDNHHLNVYGSRSLAEIFVKNYSIIPASQN